MMPALAMASLPPLPGLAQLGPARPAAAEEVDLFPAFKGAEDGDWQVRPYIRQKRSAHQYWNGHHSTLTTFDTR